MRYVAAAFVVVLRRTHWILSAPALLLAAGCGGGGGGSPPPPPAPATFAVGGTVTGLTGTGLVLQNNGGDNRSITANGAFSFTTRLASGAAYDVTVFARPVSPTSQACVVGNGDGNVASVNVTSINVVCGPAPGKFLYATYDDPVALRGYTINGITGELSLIGAPATLSSTNVSALAVNPGGQFLYTANTGAGNISGYSIDATTGALTQIASSPFAAVSNIAALTFRPDGAFVYAPYYQNFVAAFSVNATTGTLTALNGSPYTVGIQPGRAVIDPAGKFIYVPSGGSTELYGFAIQAQGTLAAVPGSPYTTMRQRDLAIWVGASVTVLYVSNASSGPIPNDSSISAYQINTATGELSAIAGSPFGTGTAGGLIRISADGRFLFIAGTNSNGGAAITAFAINQTTGALTLAPVTNSVQVGSAGFNVSYDVDVSGRYIAVAYPTGTAATVIPVSTATGTLGPAASPSLGYVPLSGLLDRSGLFGYILQNAAPIVHPYQIEPISFFVTELPAASLGSGIAVRQALIVGIQ